MGQAKTLTPAEIDQVLHYCATRRKLVLRDRAIFLTSLWSGMRAGELAQLSISQVQEPDGQIKAEIKLRAEQTKGRQARTVYLPQKLRDELAAYLESRRIRSIDAPLFFTAKRSGFTPNTMAQHFFWLYRKAGVSGASSHSGRRNFITTLANKGVSVRVLALLAGHRSIAVTQLYIDVNDAMMRDAVALV